MIDIESLVVAEMEQMLPLPDGGRADWNDVLSRADLASTHRSWRPVLVTAVAVAALVGVGVAVAATFFGAFTGISAAQHPRTPADRIDPRLLAEIDNANAVRGPAGQLLPDSARLVRQLSDGTRFYAVATTDGHLCVLAAGLPNNTGKSDAAAMGCGSPLTQGQPSTAASFQANDQTPTISYGVAVDGVTSVSFSAGGQQVTVPIQDNVWVYEGEAPEHGTLAAHFSDGSTETFG